MANKKNTEGQGPNRKKAEDKVLAYGEVTGHYHGVEQDVYINEDKGTREFDGSTTVKHQEHHPINIPDGKWASGQVLETDHLTGMQSAVRD